MKDFFRFSWREKTASLLLLGLTLVVILVFFLGRRDRITGADNFRMFDSLVRSMMPVSDTLSVPEVKTDGNGLRTKPQAKKSKRVMLSTRDPNKMTTEDWEQLNLPGYLIRTILHYRHAGGHFNQVEDLKKIYGLDDSCYLRIVRYMDIPESSAERDTYANAGEERKRPGVSRKPVVRIIEINRSDSSDFERLAGIYPSLARRIVRYRSLLGGFVKKEQLLEVYGLNEKIFNRVKDKMTVDPLLIRKLNINICPLETLEKHPYLTSYEARAVIYYRSRYHRIDTLTSLDTKKVLSHAVFLKIEPYLKLKDKNSCFPGEK